MCKFSSKSGGVPFQISFFWGDLTRNDPIALSACDIVGTTKMKARTVFCYFNPIRSGLFQTVNDPGGGFNPIRSGLFQTANDPGGGFKSPPPPYNLENYCVNLHHIIHVHFTTCFKHVPIGIFQKIAILTIL